jgi:hypothetical protein
MFATTPVSSSWVIQDGVVAPLGERLINRLGGAYRRHDLTCHVCGRPFQGRRDRRYCSNRCWKQGRYGGNS